MSIKEKIIAAVKSEAADVKINSVTQLRRWTRDGLGENVDRLEVHFDYIGGVKGGKSYEINARDYDGIVAEIDVCIKDYLSECADKMISNLKNGII